MSVMNLDSSAFQANNIFLQPTWGCAKNCHGCYVKEKENKFLGDQMNGASWTALVEEILRIRSVIQTSQVTLALDALPARSDRDFSIMQVVAGIYASTISNYKNKDIECHITTNHINDLIKYNLGVIYNLDLLSISNILSVEQVVAAKCIAPSAKINWNVTAGDFVNQVNRQGIDSIKAILRKVDSVYLLLHKAPLGMAGNHIYNFFDAVNMIQQFKEEAPVSDGEACAAPSLLSKFNLDGCMNDAVSFLKSGFGCSSNVSRYQIWPDGRVTGCAYNSQQQYGKWATSVMDVVDNLRDAKTRYEFSGRNAGKPCTIPNELKEYRNKKHLQVIA